jgi:hypothetical protein
MQAHEGFSDTLLDILTQGVIEALCASSIRRSARCSFPHLSPFPSVACRAPFSSPRGAASVESLVFVLK